VLTLALEGITVNPTALFALLTVIVCETGVAAA
jgi:hypothetical protein